jgi:1-acyl-sn-glycerol-3-phosphate acyltransferase
VGDLCLALLSYQIQQYWVFRGRDPKKFYGPFITYARALTRLVSKKYRPNVLPYEDGVVYVCRHLDNHGPYTTLKWIPFNVHPMILSCFLDRGECYAQLTGYTFSEREGKKKKRFSLKAAIYTHGIVWGARSIGAIPVYRGSVKIAKTFRMAVEALGRGEPVIIYPDIDYRGTSDDESIYDGFLYMGELYRKRFGKSLRFVPIYIDDEHRKLEEYDAVTVDNFKVDAPRAKEYIRNAINGHPEQSSYLPESAMIGKS